MPRWQIWDVSFGPVSGASGTVTTISVPMQVPFRGRKVIASDTGSPPGSGTRIQQLVVGQKIQRPSMSGATLSTFFPPTALGNEVCWDVCQPGTNIIITVSFVQPVTFDMSVFGEALV